MINHLRTLLLNRPGAKRPALDFFLEEYVEPTFQPVALTGTLEALHELLLPARADDAFINYRLVQYLQLLHSTEFASYVTALDPRLTYLPQRTLLSNQLLPKLTNLNALAYNTAPQWTLVGTAPDSNQTLRLATSWQLDVLSTGVMRCILPAEGSASITPFSMTNGMSSPIALVRAPKLFVVFSAADLPVGASWALSSFAQPPSGLSELATQILELGSESLETLFSSAEPYATFKKLWLNGPYLQFKLGAMLLTCAYRIEEQRLRG